MKISTPSIICIALLACLTKAASAVVQKTCTNYTIPIKPTTTNLKWTNPWKSNYDLIDFVSNFTAGIEGSPYATETFQSTGNYNISATFCRPAGNNYPTEKSGIVLLLNHGLNFDRSYVTALSWYVLLGWKTDCL
jgi:hypothetical protein